MSNTSEPSSFESLLEARRAEEQAARDLMERNRQKNLAEMKIVDYHGQTDAEKRQEELDRVYTERAQGTLPEHVWGDEAGRLCREFLDFMRMRDFPGAEFLGVATVYEDVEVVQASLWGLRKKVTPTPVARKVPGGLRGYPVGVIGRPHDFAREVHDLFYTEEKARLTVRDVFLAEDGTLQRKVGSEPAFPLPIVIGNRIVMPVIGSVTQGRTKDYIEYMEVEHGDGSNWREPLPGTRQKPTRAILNETTLEQQLTTIALEALRTLPPSPITLHPQ